MANLRREDEMETIDKNRARHLLRTLDFDDWMMISVVFPPRSISQKRMRSLEEMELTLIPNEKMYPSIQPEKVLAWIEEKVGDKDLAAELEPIVADGSLNYLQKCVALGKAVNRRCDMLRAAAGGEDA